MAEVLDSIKYVLEGWQVTVAASVVFACILIVTLAIWGLMRWRYGGIIEKKDATIDALDKSKIAVISTLEARIILAKDAIEQLVREIERLNGTVTTLKSQASAAAHYEQLVLTIVHAESIVMNIARLSDQLANTMVLNATEAPDIANFRGTVE